MENRYPKEVKEKIEELQNQIKELKEKYKYPAVIDERTVIEIAKITDSNYSTICANIRNIAKMVCAKKSNHSNISSAKINIKDLNEDEQKNARKCADEIISILMKYAKETNDVI